LVEDSLGLHKISEKLSKNSFFLKFKGRISTEFGKKPPEISGQTDEYSPTKKIKQSRTQTNLPFRPGSDE